MALDQAYLASLGLEIAKKKYYNAAKVEDVVEAFCRREAALTQEKNVLAQSNETLRERLEALSLGREEIGDAILSAKTISQQLIGEARDKAEAMTAESVESADALIAATRSHDFGETVTLQVERPGEEDPVSVDVTLSSE